MANSLQSITPSDRHVAFVEGVLAGKELDKAGKDAGFKLPARDAYPILATPEVRQYVRKKLRGRAETEGLAVTYNFLISVVRDESADKRLRVDCAKFIYAHHMPAHKALEVPSDDEKSPSEMSNEELARFISENDPALANAKAEAAARASPIIEAEVIDTPQAIDSIL